MSSDLNASPDSGEAAQEAVARIVCEIVVRITCPDYASEASIQGAVGESWKHWTDTADRILALRQSPSLEIVHD